MFLFPLKLKKKKPHKKCQASERKKARKRALRERGEREALRKWKEGVRMEIISVVFFQQFCMFSQCPIIFVYATNWSIVLFLYLYLRLYPNPNPLTYTQRKVD